MEKDATLTIVLRHDSSHVSHNIGRFRLSGSGLPEARLDHSNILIAVLQVSPDKRTQEQRQQVVAGHRAADTAYAALVVEQERLTKLLTDLRGSFPKVMVMQDLPEPRKTWVLTRGLYSKHGAEVTANIPEKLPPLQEGETINRLALARWIVSDDNPLTAR